MICADDHYFLFIFMEDKMRLQPNIVKTIFDHSLILPIDVDPEKSGKVDLNVGRDFAT